MIDKFAMTKEQYATMRARNSVLQEHVCGYFRSHWPSLYEFAANEGLYRKPCPDDFRLKLPERMLGVDVSGERYYGGWSAPPFKRKTDIHILANIDDAQDHIVMHGFVPGSEFATGVFSEWTNQPIQRLIFKLNVTTLGLDYSLFRHPEVVRQ